MQQGSDVNFFNLDLEAQSCFNLYAELESLKSQLEQLEFKVSQAQNSYDEWVSFLGEKEAEISRLIEEREALVATVCKQHREERRLLNQLALAEEKLGKLRGELSLIRGRAAQSESP